jgi:hypothetical protein
MECIDNLRRVGIEYDDAVALRRISMTLHRWHELKCGDGNNYSSWSIERDEVSEKPFMYVYPYDGKMRRYPVADRETGALKRLKAIMARYPSLSYYVQGDPRGASLYVLRPGDVPEGKEADAYYSRGVAVYK